MTEDQPHVDVPADGEDDQERMDDVDRHPDAHRPTEADEEAVLHEMYGEPDQYGVYRAVED